MCLLSIRPRGRSGTARRGSARSAACSPRLVLGHINTISYQRVPDDPATTHHSFGGPFSAVSTPVLAIERSFCRIFQNLESKLTEFQNFFKTFQNFAGVARFSLIFGGISGFCKFCKILLFFLAKCRAFLQFCENPVASFCRY